MSILYAEKNQRVVLSRVQLQMRVPFDRLKNYVFELRELDLIDDVVSLKLTEKGKRFIEEYQRILDFMKQMGKSYK